MYNCSEPNKIKKQPKNNCIFKTVFKILFGDTSHRGNMQCFRDMALNSYNISLLKIQQLLGGTILC